MRPKKSMLREPHREFCAARVCIRGAEIIVGRDVDIVPGKPDINRAARCGHRALRVHSGRLYVFCTSQNGVKTTNRGRAMRAPTDVFDTVS